MPDDTKYSKDSVKSPPEIICRRVTQDEVLSEVSEFDSEIIQLLSRCGRENIPERLANWLENTEQSLKYVPQALNCYIPAAEILPFIEQLIPGIRHLPNHAA